MSRYGRDENPDQEIPISNSENAKLGTEHPTHRKSHGSIGNLELESPVRPSSREHEVPLRNYEISETQVAAMADIGMFRAVNLKDLTIIRYGGDEKQALREINNLLRQSHARRRQRPLAKLSRDAALSIVFVQ